METKYDKDGYRVNTKKDMEKYIEVKTKDMIIRNGAKEWYCEHGIGHYIEKINPKAVLIHGCDGCCHNLPNYASLEEVQKATKIAIDEIGPVIKRFKDEGDE